MTKTRSQITQSSTAEYFAKNLQQVGFSSPAKAVLTTLKEAVDNSLDACEEFGILPEISVVIEKKGKGHLRHTDRILIRVEDNGPGLSLEQVPMVFGEYLASSKFGRGRCSRGQQGIGISAATTWAVQTSATGAKVLTKQKNMKKALSCLVVTDLKNNKGVLKEKTMTDWDKPHGTSVEFLIDGRLQMNGEGGILAYLRGNILLNPHLTLKYNVPDLPPTTIERVSTIVPEIPPAQPPHPHTMKLGEFMSHARLFGRIKLSEWLQRGFSRVSAHDVAQIVKTSGYKANFSEQTISSMSAEDFKKIFSTIQEMELRPPATKSVITIGEEALSISIQRLGEIDYFAVVSRRPIICDLKPVQVEVAVARLLTKSADQDQPIQVLRFANRVPLQFDRASCAIVKAISSVNWRAYNLKQSRNSLPTGPYIIAVSIVSPFIKFKNASKETIDASDELVEEIRGALMKAGLKLSRHLKKESKERELESKLQHIEKFSPILVETLCRILQAKPERRERAEAGLLKILGRDNKETAKELQVAENRLAAHLSKNKRTINTFSDEDKLLLHLNSEEVPLGLEEVQEEAPKKGAVPVEEEEPVAAEKNAGRKKSTKKKHAQLKKAAKKTATPKKAAKKTATPKKAAKKTAAAKKATAQKKATTSKKTPKAKKKRK
jgi:DNA topoisomerase-6 subunit B